MTRTDESSRAEGDSPLPLRGLRVLDLAGESAPHCGQLLALFGADVVLVERGTSQDARTDLAWVAFNAGKRSVQLEPDEPEERDEAKAARRENEEGQAEFDQQCPDNAALQH